MIKVINPRPCYYILVFLRRYQIMLLDYRGSVNQLVNQNVNNLRKIVA